MDSTPSRMEFAVQMTCQSCVNSIKNSLSGIEGIHEVDINLSQEQVVITTVLPSAEVKEILESTGRKAVFKGQGSNITGNHLGAAVCMIETGDPVRGVVRLLQVAEDNCIVEGTIDGLSPGNHSLRIHEFGDISDGCSSCGNVFDARGFLHGQSASSEKLTGDLGVITAESNGRSLFRMENSRVKVWDIIGRSLVVGDLPDATSQISAKFGVGIACGIIARSAGLFENTKKICACDGITLWDERNVPVAGKARSEFVKAKASAL
ncbi:copper chaperone for superoxide dismutase-like [Diadema antillarum]|uniref:copper chaperone for superoxide dismutase-like n=1 Tax=Diadema antillarum TaxID=105358 RepID=UPI003A8AB956